MIFSSRFVPFAGLFFKLQWATLHTRPGAGWSGILVPCDIVSNTLQGPCPERTHCLAGSKPCGHMESWQYCEIVWLLDLLRGWKGGSGSKNTCGTSVTTQVWIPSVQIKADTAAGVCNLLLRAEDCGGTETGRLLKLTAFQSWCGCHERPCLKERKQRAVEQDPVPSSGLPGHTHRRMHLHFHVHTHTPHTETTHMLIYTQEQTKALDLVVAWRKTFRGSRWLSCAFKN